MTNSPLPANALDVDQIDFDNAEYRRARPLAQRGHTNTPHLGQY